MSLILLAASAWAGTALYTRQPIAAGQALDDGSLYALELPEALHPAGSLDGPPSLAIGRVARFDLPADTLLRDGLLHPAGPGGRTPQGHALHELELPAPLSLRVADAVDLWVEQADRWCLAAESLPVVEVDGARVVLAVPEAAHRTWVATATRSALALRGPTDRDPSTGPACEARP